jgi:hypothetical protein
LLYATNKEDSSIYKEDGNNSWNLLLGKTIYLATEFSKNWQRDFFMLTMGKSYYILFTMRLR